MAPNQVPRMPEHDAYGSDPSMQFWYHHLSGDSDPGNEEILHGVGHQVGGWRLQDCADRANRVTPELKTWDRTGTRIDDVEFDPSWHELLDAVTSSGAVGLPWTHPGGGYLTRAVAAEQWARLDVGVLCPVSMTTAAIPVLRRALGADHPLVAKLCAGTPGQALAGMAMTEPQGGSDLAGSSTIATTRDDGSFVLNGHKWFCSHPVADILLVLAREPGLDEGSRGLSCFLVQGWREDGSRNGIEIQRLKDKLGTRSLASGEVVFRDTEATRLGGAGEGVRTIIEMVVHTRMDCSIGSTGVMTRAVQEAIHYASHRSAFGARLIDQPLMRATLTDLVLEREGALALAVDVANTFEEGDEEHRRLHRIIPAIAKYWITRRAVTACIEVVEALGGNGYTEEFVPARLYRDAQVNSTWEGSGNVIVLDVFRALTADFSLLATVRDHVRTLMVGSSDAAELADEVLATVPTGGPMIADGRRFVADLATALQAALLIHRANVTGEDIDSAIARVFVETRIRRGGPRYFGDGGELLLEISDELLSRLGVGAGNPRVTTPA